MRVDHKIEHTIHLYNIVSKLGQRRSIERTSQQTLHICITFVQRRPNVFDAGPTLYKNYTHVLCLLGLYKYSLGLMSSQQTQHPEAMLV